MLKLKNCLYSIAFNCRTVPVLMPEIIGQGMFWYLKLKTCAWFIPETEELFLFDLSSSNTVLVIIPEIKELRFFWDLKQSCAALNPKTNELYMF